MPSAAATASPSRAGTWTDTAIAGLHGVGTIVERDGRLMATGRSEASSSGAIAISDDGETWQPVDMPTTGQFYSIVPGEAGFVAVTTNYPIVMGPPEYGYLFSSDGRTWNAAEQPSICVSAEIVAYGAGFLGIGYPCRGEGDFAPSVLHVLESPDGHAWTSRRDETLRPGAWATDGRRVVMLQHRNDDFMAGPIDVQISDDGARTWRQVAEPFPSGFHPDGLFHGHGKYVARASFNRHSGDPQSAVCVSTDGETWTCETIAEPDGELEGRNWLARHVAITPTGFVSLGEYVNDPALGGDGSTDMVLATSRDGLSWTFKIVPELKDRIAGGIAWTSRGLYSWGGLNRDITPDAYVPYLVVHTAPLP